MIAKGILALLDPRKNIIKTAMLDRMDRKILEILQKDCTVPVAEIGTPRGPLHDAVLASHSEVRARRA